jgi:heme-degrading monooxygenase HmoA
MIARAWRGFAKPERADAYRRHFTAKVAPHLKDLSGHVGAFLLQKERGDEVEFLALTLWDSIESVKAFTGPDPQVAIVEPEGQAALSHFEEVATNYEVVFSTADDFKY